MKAVITLTEVARNGGDGIELDERGDGNAEFDVSRQPDHPQRQLRRDRSIRTTAWTSTSPGRGA